MLFRGLKTKVRKTFVILTLLISIWVVSNYAADHVSDYYFALLLTRTTYFATSLIPLILVYFATIFPRTTFEIKFWKKIVISFFPIMVALLSFSDLIVNEIKQESWGVNVVIGNLYGVFILEFVLLMLTAFLMLWKKLKSNFGLQKLQIQYVFTGLLLGAIGGALFNLVIPTITGSFSNTKYGPYFSIFYVGFIAYAIAKHRLLDIRLAIVRTISFTLSTVIIASVFVAFLLYVPQQFENIFIRGLFAIIISIVLVIIIGPIKNITARYTDKYFFSASINYDLLLKSIGEIISREYELEKLVNNIVNTLKVGLKVQYVKILFSRNDGEVFLSDNIEISSVQHGNLFSYIQGSRSIINKEALIQKLDENFEQKQTLSLEHSRDELDSLNASVIIPVVSNGHVTTLLMIGNRLSGEAFSKQDFSFFEIISPQLASALEKARLYEEIRLFNVKLQKEVEIATERVKMKNVQLEDRNRFLAAVSKVTNLITQTLEFKKVTQSIVDAIATELGFVGGLLLFLGESRRKVFPEAVTNKPVTQKVLKLLPKPLNEYWGDFTTDKTLNIEAMKAQQVRTGTDLAAFLSPPVPKMVLGAIQKVAGIKTIVSVPVIAEQEVVGCIDFMIAKTPDLVTKNDYDMMQAMANQTGVVYRNIELVRRLEGSNRELGEANEHLKELDQAKSEFVSIASHQLRTPMTGIMGYLSMIVGGDFGKLDASLQKVLEQLLDASQRMIRLINLFLDVTKIESGKLSLDKQPVHLEELIDKELQVLQKLASDKKLKLVYTKPKVALPVLMIDDKITDVVLNLVDNAIKYTVTGGITITSEREGDWVHVKVQDTGRGLDPKEARSLFNKFVRGYGIAQVNPDGSGLGLYVARRLVEVHGGRIWVESDGPGKGSCFQFTLPIKAVDAKFEPAGAALVTSPKPVVE